MSSKQVQVADSFRESTVKAIFSIALFLFTYLFLIVLAIGLTIVCAYLGIMLILFKPMWLTLMLGIGLISVGVFVLIFLLKFMFSKHKVDLSHLVELKKESQPELFSFIGEIVNEVDTKFPKKIYMSAEVNAAVFYDSSFWSMFLPIRKNLQIGAALVNSVSVTEFKAILAHEFGHFSQKSMKVGSYVYNVNKVIYNMLYENKGFADMASQWANASSYFLIFVRAAIWIVTQIQTVLRRVYDVVNLNYMRLSREMEFHADEVAANITGSKPLATSLLRLDLAGRSYDEVINYYNGKIQDSVKTPNVFPKQQYVLRLIGKESGLPFAMELPQVSLQHLSRFNQSKLVITNQWASHPSIEDRVHRLENLGLPVVHQDDRLANVLFNDFETVQEKLTENLFSSVSYQSEVSMQRDEQFMEEFTQKYRSATFDHRYNNYYDVKDIPKIPADAIRGENGIHLSGMADLFSSQQVDKVYSAISLERDIAILTQIMDGTYPIKTFDYDGEKYEPIGCHYLIPKLENDFARIKSEILENDIRIFKYFTRKATENARDADFRNLYNIYLETDQVYDDYINIYHKMDVETAFISQTTPFAIIEDNLVKLEETEVVFRAKLKELMFMELFSVELTPERKEGFEKYLSSKWIYFTHPEYNNEALSVFFNALRLYRAILAEGGFRHKKALLDYQIFLESGSLVTNN